MQIKVDDVKVKEIPENNPGGMNSFVLYKDGTRNHRSDPSDFAAACQRLYECGYSSYPRTETTKYPYIPDGLAAKTKFYDAAIILKILGEDVKDIKFVGQTEYGDDHGDHPPIMPICDNFKAFSRRFVHQMSNAEKNVLKSICKYYLAAGLGEYIYKSKVASLTVAKFPFEFKNTYLVSPGWTAMLPKKHDGVHNFDDIFVRGKTIRISNTETTECDPPSYLSEYELIELMEENCIGTDGTVPKHIEKLKINGFVKISDDRRIYPEPFARDLVTQYRKDVPELIKPEFRKKFNEDINDVAHGRKDFVKVSYLYISFFFHS